MPYNDWNERAHFASESEWLSTESLREYLVFLDGTKFALATARQAAIDHFAKLPRETPVKRDKQFPEWVAYIHIDGGDWPNKIRQLITALNYKEPSATKEGKQQQTPGKSTGGGLKNEETKLDNTEVKDNIPDDVLLSFTTAIQTMRNQLARGDSVFIRSKFERQFSVNWT